MHFIWPLVSNLSSEIYTMFELHIIEDPTLFYQCGPIQYFELWSKNTVLGQGWRFVQWIELTFIFSFHI